MSMIIYKNKIRNILSYKSLGSLLLCFLLFTISSCRTMTPSYDYKSLAQASMRLGVDIDMEDNHHLYIESSKWIKTPHRFGGVTQIGVDCSGFTQHIYQTVYRKKIPRNSHQQYIKSQKVTKNRLREGDLVFFSTSRTRKQVNHVGIYLKNDLFIHTSSSKGVMVSNLNESYFKRNWISGGRY